MTRALARFIMLIGIFPALSCESQPAALAARSLEEGQGSEEGSGEEVDYAGDKAKLDDVRAFYYAVFGRDHYTTNWGELDNYRSGSGIPERKPYLDSWYPQARGGTNVNGALSRYDRAFYNGQARAAAWEAREHSGTVSWYGHCDGTSAASIRFQNPQKSVGRPRGCSGSSASCTVFSPGDIRALLSEINMNARAKFIAGTRCKLTSEQLDQRPFPRSNPRSMDACDDVNPASFHVGLVNFLGRMKQPLVFDESYDEQVWNYPIYSYSYTSSGPLSASQALSAAGLSGSTWIFNPQAVSFYRITMTVNYRTSRSDFQGAGTVPAALTEKTYTYILELNKERQVIGGEWIGASRSDHPDFVWMPFEPAPPQGENGAGNPHLSNSEVIKIWAESVGLDPESPFRDKPDNPYDVRFYPSPAENKSWGRVVGYYQVVLDGRRTGATFLGKKTYLRIEVAEPLRQQAQVEVLVNGRSAGKSLVSGDRIDVQLDSKPGINVLGLRWNSSLVDNKELNWDFRYYAM